MSSARTNAQVALECAANFLSGRHTRGSTDALAVADKFLAWLEKQDSPEVDKQ